MAHPLLASMRQIDKRGLIPQLPDGPSPFMDIEFYRTFMLVWHGPVGVLTEYQLFTNPLNAPKTTFAKWLETSP